MKLRCVIDRITYQNPDNGYSVLKVRAKGYTEDVTLVGNLLEAVVGMVLLVEGEWKVDSRYGPQFEAQSWEEVLPSSIYGIEKYLGSGLIKGVGPVFAKKIVSQFGLQTIDIIEESPDKLYEVPGIGKRRVEQIKESWEQHKDIKNIMLFLQSQQVSTGYAAKIFKTYGKDSLSVLKENPYRLADDIWGIGFKTADSIAMKLGFKEDDPRRCRSALIYTLGQLSDDGHVYSAREDLLSRTLSMMQVDAELLERVLDETIGSGDLKTEEGKVYLPSLYYSEIGVSSSLRRLISTEVPQSLFGVFDIGEISRRTHVQYDGVQADAIRYACSSKVMVLTGGPGTGKTTTVKGIIEAFNTMGLKILLAAPTGRAAKRMTEATGMPAKTIHRLLECRPPEGYLRNEGNRLEGDALIVDEVSMVDIVLMNALLKALPDRMRLILVGDVDQLPSVGPGNVLRDIISSGTVKVVTLSHIFRQAQTSRIIMNAHRINRGEFPDTRNGRQSDFFFIGEEDAGRIAPLVVSLIKDRLPQAYKLPQSSIQVLTPKQKGVTGCQNLNAVIQDALNPSTRMLRRSGFMYKLGDKVMQIKNNYNKEVFNGDIGKICSVNEGDDVLVVDYDGRQVPYEKNELDELQLAYAITIHKSQGCEFPVVVIPLVNGDYMMLQRNLLYTAVTRAKKVCILVGTKKAIAIAVNNYTVVKRNTTLSERLASAMPWVVAGNSPKV